MSTLQWFWEIARELGTEQRARLLQFATGLSSAPVGGFAHLKPRRFNIVIDGNPEHYPTAVTCFATLRLPLSDCKQALAVKLRRICAQRDMRIGFGER